MYCTGGIRCDVYSTFLRQQGFDNLYTLEGGIQSYLEEESSDHWKGSLYVFDDRMAVAPSHLRFSREGEKAVSNGSSGTDCSENLATSVHDASDNGSNSKTSEPVEAGADEKAPGHDAEAQGGVEGRSDSGKVVEDLKVEFEKPRAAVPCVLCGGEPELPHINCANVDCNVLLLICDYCKAELSGCCSEECRDHAPRLVRPVKDGECYLILALLSLPGMCFWGLQGAVAGYPGPLPIISGTSRFVVSTFVLITADCSLLVRFVRELHDTAVSMVLFPREWIAMVLSCVTVA